MKCEVCGDGLADIFIMLPIKKPDGCLETIVCHSCAQKSSAYCIKHQRHHLGFSDDNTTACVVCIEEIAAGDRFREGTIFDVLKNNLPQQEFQRLLEMARFSSRITNNKAATCVLRFIATKALRTNSTIDAVLQKILNDKSVNFIIPAVPVL